jgi:hypothetical protein
MDPDRRALEVTERQAARLKWWAKRLGVATPVCRNRGEASDIIDQWEKEHPHLIDAWEYEKEKRSDREDRKQQKELESMDVAMIALEINDWRNFYGCRYVPKSKAKAAVRVVGVDGFYGDRGKFMDAVFTELRRCEPALFAKRKRRGRRKSSTFGSLVLLGLVLYAIYKYFHGSTN